MKRVVATLLLAVLVGAGCSVVGRGGDTYAVDAVFTRAIGVYPGSPVRQLGIEVGRITDVENTGDTVRVTMRIEDGTALPADAHAVIVPVTALGERYIQLAPVYESGPRLGDGDTIPVERTEVPFEIDELLEGLDDYLGAIDPEHAGDLVTNLAAIVEGRGEDLNELIGTAADSLDLLADKGDELGTIVDSLAELSRTLGGRTRTIQELVRSYEQVSGVLGDQDESLNRFILDLNDMAVEVRGLLDAHDEPLRDDIGNLTTVGRTLQRNLSRLDTLITETPRLFAAAQLAYDAEHNVLPLNNAVDPGVTTDLYRSRLRDRLAGICRRLIVRFTGSPLAASLASSGCSSTSSDFWDPLFAVPGPPPLPLVASPPTNPELPPAPPVPAAPEAPSLDDLAQGLDLILGLLDPNQLGALGSLDPGLLRALGDLTAQQLRGLMTLSPAQMRRLGNVDPDRLTTVLDQMLRNDFDPGDVLDTPLLPRSGDGDGNGLLGVGLP